MAAHRDARRDDDMNRDKENGGHEENQKLTTMPRRWSARSQEVGLRRSSVTSHRDAKLTGADWGLPCLPGLIEEDEGITAEL
jgi:hypothetical protein